MSLLRRNLSRLKGRVIAIDGPAGSGKSTTAKALAERLEYVYLDTGAMYRALTLKALDQGIALSDGQALVTLAESLDIRFQPEAGSNRVFVNGEEVTNQIRMPEVTQAVSEVSAHKGVREVMVRQQRKLGEAGSVVAEGRDTTTVVFPNADIKIYLTASVKERARRRLLDLSKMGVTTSLAEQEADLQRRDSFDSNRQHSPLTRAGDAHTVDTTDMTVDGQIDYIISLILSLK